MNREAQLSFRLTQELKNALQRRADAEHRALAQYVQLVLQEHVDGTPEPTPGRKFPRKS